jgi:DNA modification methylase
MKVKDQFHNEKFSMYNGDSGEILCNIPDNSIHYEIYSPPFASLYTYSNSERDLGNCRNYEEFFQQYEFIGRELHRILKPGRLMSVHCMDLPTTKEHHGYIGMQDFPGDIIRMFIKLGFIYHSRVTIWKDPLIAATRTKAIGLLHKQIIKDSALCRNGVADYVVTFRKRGENTEPIAHSSGFTGYYGDNEPKEGVYSHQVWRRYASPVWMDIDQNDTLNRANAREDNDERHICPLQLPVIARCLELWSNKGDVVLTPFAGIGSEVYQSILMGRRGVGIELKDSYYSQAVSNCKYAAYITENNQYELDLGFAESLDRSDCIGD